MSRRSKKSDKANGTGLAHAPEGAVERNRHVEKLPCKVNGPEQEHASKQLAACVRAVETLDEERREANAGFRERLAGIKDRMQEYATTVEMGTEVRGVLCIDYLLPNQSMRTVRTDTGEVLGEDRPATAEELQEPMAIADADEQSEAEAAMAATQRGDGPIPEEATAGE